MILDDITVNQKANYKPWVGRIQKKPIINLNKKYKT